MSCSEDRKRFIIHGIFIKLMMIMGIIIASLMIAANAYAKDADGDYVVIIDPGHGAQDCGASYNGLEEAKLNWRIATVFKAQLETYSGVKVYLTRGSGECMSLTGRGRYGMNLGADLIVSVHNNANANADANGTISYVTAHPTFSSQMATLGAAISSANAALGLADRGYSINRVGEDVSGNARKFIGFDYYTVLYSAANVGIPGLIVEHAFVSNANDAAFLSVDANLVNLGINDGNCVAAYLGLSKRTVPGGSSIDLTRTYSAQFQSGIEGATYSSSDADVAYVSPEGLITAVAQGTAVITAEAGGASATVTVNVPAVYQVGIAAGITTTYYESISAPNPDWVIVKAQFSDGSSVQLPRDSYTIGALGAAQSDMMDRYATITYGNFTTDLVVFEFAYGSAQNNNLSNPTSANTDILVLPNGSTNITPQIVPIEVPTVAPIITPTEAPTQAPTEEPTEAVTEASTEAPTEEVTKAEETTTEDESETAGREDESETIETTADKTTAADETTSEDETTIADNSAKNNNVKWIAIVSAISVVLLSAIVFLIIKVRKH